MAWTCTTCEFPNSTDAENCIVCDAPAPVDRREYDEESEEYLDLNDPFFD